MLMNLNQPALTESRVAAHFGAWNAFLFGIGDSCRHHFRLWHFRCTLCWGKRTDAIALCSTSRGAGNKPNVYLRYTLMLESYLFINRCFFSWVFSMCSRSKRNHDFFLLVCFALRQHKTQVHTIERRQSQTEIHTIIAINGNFEIYYIRLCRRRIEMEVTASSCSQCWFLRLFLCCFFSMNSLPINAIPLHSVASAPAAVRVIDGLAHWAMSMHMSECGKGHWRDTINRHVCDRIQSIW